MQWLTQSSSSGWGPHVTHPASSSCPCALCSRTTSLLPAACGSQDHGGKVVMGICCQPKACACHTEAPEVLYPFTPSPSREQRGQDFSSFRQCPSSNRHQHYSFPFLFLQGGVSVGLRKVCKGQTMPHWCSCFIFPCLPYLPAATTLVMAKSLTL